MNHESRRNYWRWRRKAAEDRVPSKVWPGLIDDVRRVRAEATAPKTPEEHRIAQQSEHKAKIGPREGVTK